MIINVNKRKLSRTFLLSSISRAGPQSEIIPHLLHLELRLRVIAQTFYWAIQAPFEMNFYLAVQCFVFCKHFSTCDFMAKLITFILEHDSQGTYLHVWTRTTQDHLKMKLLSKTNPNIQALKIEIIHKANLIFQALKITVIQKANSILRAFKIDNICKKYNQRWRLHRVHCLHWLHSFGGKG